MPLDFPTLVFMNSALSVFVIAYYYYWGVSAPLERKAKTKEIIMHVKNAYALTGFANAFMPLILLYYLWGNLLYQFQQIFYQTAFVIFVLVLIFEYVNFYSYTHYERHRLKA